MGRDDVIKKLRERLTAPPKPPLEATRDFLFAFCMDMDGMAEVEARIARFATLNPLSLYRGLAGIEAVLVDPPSKPHVLRRMVACDLGVALADDSDTGTRLWLKQLAVLLRRHLPRAPTPPPNLYGSGELP
jgi:hypothetical protein